MRELHYLFVMRLPLNRQGSLTPMGIHQSIFSASGIIPYLNGAEIDDGDVMIFCSDENVSVETARQVTEILKLNDELNIVINPLWPKSTNEKGGRVKLNSFITGSSNNLHVPQSSFCHTKIRLPIRNTSKKRSFFV